MFDGEAGMPDAPVQSVKKVGAGEDAGGGSQTASRAACHPIRSEGEGGWEVGGTQQRIAEQPRQLHAGDRAQAEGKVGDANTVRKLSAASGGAGPTVGGGVPRLPK